MSYFLFIGKSLAMLSHHRGRFLLFIVFSICAALTERAGVVMLVPILESIGNESMFSNTLVFQNVSSLFDGLEPSERLRAAAIAMFLIVIIRSILLYASQYLAASLPQRIRTKLSLRAYNALMEASFTYILGANSGEIQNTIKMLPSRISVLLTDIGLVIINMLIATVYFILMLFISWKMTLAALLFIWILSEAVKFGSHKRMREFGKRITEHANTVHQILYESLNSMSLIRKSVV